MNYLALNLIHAHDCDWGASYDYGEWLDSAAKDPGKLLTPCPVDELVRYPVNPVVNNARNQGPQCIEPVK